jgi:hypothetical protein
MPRTERWVPLPPTSVGSCVTGTVWSRFSVNNPTCRRGRGVSPEIRCPPSAKMGGTLRRRGLDRASPSSLGAIREPPRRREREGAQGGRAGKPRICDRKVLTNTEGHSAWSSSSSLFHRARLRVDAARQPGQSRARMFARRSAVLRSTRCHVSRPR